MNFDKTLDEIQRLYNKTENDKQIALNIYNQRINYLDNLFNHLTKEKSNDLLLNWEFEQNKLFNVNNKRIKISNENYKRFDFDIKNQFHSSYNLENSNKSCVTISLMFCFFFYSLKIENKSIDSEYLKFVMNNGILLYNRWKNNKLKLNQDFPLIDEILKEKSTEKFNKLFTGIEIYDGIVKINNIQLEMLKNKEKHFTLSDLFIESIKIMKNKPLICIVLVCKRHYTFSIILSNPKFPKDINNKKQFKFDIYFFDSHGRNEYNDDKVDFILFYNIDSTIDYILNKLDIGEIQNKDHQDYEDNNLNQLEFVEKYGYTATLFYEK